MRGKITLTKSQINVKTTRLYMHESLYTSPRNTQNPSYFFSTDYILGGVCSNYGREVSR